MYQRLNYIYRTATPTKLDTAEFKTVCKVTNLNSKEFYVQMSRNAEVPNWGKLGGPSLDEDQITKLLDLIE